MKSGARPRNWLDCRGVREHECGADDPSQECRGLNVNHTTSMKRTPSTHARTTQHRQLRISAFGLLSGVGIRASDFPSHTPGRWKGRGTGMLLTCWLAGAMFAVGLSAAAAGLAVEGLRCEYLDNPLGIDTPQPRLSWVLESRQRAQTQTAYQMLVASSEALLKADSGDLWDTGKVTLGPNRAGGLCGQGAGLVPALLLEGARVGQGRQGLRLQRAGLLGDGFARRRRIGRASGLARTTDTNSLPAPLLRRAFTLEGKIKQARAYICGLGYYELHLNGKKIGDHLLDPGYTRYDRRALYVTYDVTDALRRGKNAVGVILGNGWYNVQTRAVWDFHKAPVARRAQAADAVARGIRRRARRNHRHRQPLEDQHRADHLRQHLRRRDLRCPRGEAGLGHAGLRRFRLGHGAGGRRPRAASWRRR